MPHLSLWGDEDVTLGDLAPWGVGWHQGTQKCGVALGDLALQGVG